jgi:hypothetical protein
MHGVYQESFWIMLLPFVLHLCASFGVQLKTFILIDIVHSI